MKSDAGAWAEIDRDIARRNAEIRAQAARDRWLIPLLCTGLFIALVWLCAALLSP